MKTMRPPRFRIRTLMIAVAVVGAAVAAINGLGLEDTVTLAGLAPVAIVLGLVLWWSGALP